MELKRIYLIGDLIKASQELAEKEIKIEDLESSVEKQKTRGDNLFREVDRLKRALAEETNINAKNSMNEKLEQKLKETMGQLVLLKSQKDFDDQEITNLTRQNGELKAENDALKEENEFLKDPKGKKKKKK